EAACKTVSTCRRWARPAPGRAKKTPRHRRRGFRSTEARISERNIVVEIAEAAGIRRRRGFLGGGRRRLGGAALGLVAVVVGGCVITAATAAGTAVEHLHVAGDDLGGVAVLAVLPLPFAGTQAPLHIHLGTLLQVLLGDLRQAVEEHHPVPLGALLGLPGVLVLPGFAGGDADVGDGATARHVAGFRVLAQIA